MKCWSTGKEISITAEVSRKIAIIELVCLINLKQTALNNNKSYIIFYLAGEIGFH